MTDNYSTDLEYQEIRRRIERRLGRGYGLLAHVFVYLVAVTIIVWKGLYQYPDYNNYPWLINTALTGVFAVWSVLLAAHGFFRFQRSAFSGRLEGAIEAELQERLEQDDTMLMRDRRGALPLHHLLQGDIRRRAVLIYTLLPYLDLNAVVWLYWVYERLTNANGEFLYYPWISPFYLPLIIGPLLVLGFILQWQRRRYVRRVLASWETAVPKLKRNLAAYEEIEESRPVQLTEDGELVDWPEENHAELRKNKRSG